MVLPCFGTLLLLLSPACVTCLEISENSYQTVSSDVAKSISLSDSTVTTTPQLPSGIKGVYYAPHLIGQPFGDGDVYATVYRQLHKRDLNLMKSHLGADTVMLRPWDSSQRLSSSMDHSAFIAEVKTNNLNVIVTFPMQRWYAKMAKDETGSESPTVDPTVTTELADFFDSVSDLKKQVIAWTVDLSLSVSDIGDIPASSTSKCGDPSQMALKSHFQMYKALLSAIHSVAHGRGFDTEKLFLLPLDLDMAQSTTAANKFISCASMQDGDGGWDMSTFFQGWIFSISIPLYADVNFEPEAWVKSHFTKKLTGTDGVLNGGKDGCSGSVLECYKKSAIMMVGAGSVRIDPQNRLHLVEDYGASEGVGNQQQQILKQVWQETKDLSTQGVKGLILDEWADDWDRGKHGVFWIADGKTDQRACGGRYQHDAASFNAGCLKDLVVPPVDSSTKPAVEYFGITAQYTIAFLHCVVPRFYQKDGFIFESALLASSDQQSYWHCRVMEPSVLWLSFLGIAVFVAMLIHLCTCVSRRERATRVLESVEQNGESVVHTAVQRGSWTTAGNRSLTSSYRGLHPGDSMGDDDETGTFSDRKVNHQVECRISSTRFEILSREERVVRLVAPAEADKKWLATALRAHLRAQTQRLERQIHAEFMWIESEEEQKRLQDQRSRMRQSASAGSNLSEQAATLLSEDMRWKMALQTIHTRVLEGFHCWAESRFGRSEERKLSTVLRNENRSDADLFGEVVLLRLMESLGEHMINAPERLQHLLYKILMEAGTAQPEEHVAKRIYKIEYEKLQEGLSKMHKEPNPFKGGINFDDINECGARRIEPIKKTFQEARNLMVVVDGILCFRSVIAMKLWCFCIAIYIFLGSGLGTASVTSGNGTFLAPQWLRANFIQYIAMIDACCWALLQVTLFVYRTWQKGLDFERLSHLGSLALTLCGGFFVFQQRDILEKPENLVDDPRLTKYPFLCGAEYAAAYMVLRLVFFVISHRRRRPIWIYGTPFAGRHRGKARKRRERWIKDLVAVATWAFILGICVAFEAFMILPITSGMDWQRQCGLKVSMLATQIDKYQNYGGACSSQWLRADCASCSFSVIALWSLVIMCGVTLDIFFVFYVFSAVVGFFMGHRRGLNNFKNPMRTVDLTNDVAKIMQGDTEVEICREKGTQAVMMRRIFGPEWRTVWIMIVKGLFEEDLINADMADELAHAAGMDMPVQREADVAAGSGLGPQVSGSFSSRGLSDSGRRDETLELKEVQQQGTAAASSAQARPFDLANLPEMASERLTTFFASLPGILGTLGDLPQHAKHKFRPERDALSACHVGTVPSLSQIIPAYNEIVIPSSKHLRRGYEKKDARNQKNDKTTLRTEQARGDGLNSNIGFIASQRVEEWVFLSERLKYSSPQNLFKDFMQDRLNTEQENEVRLWAALRSQTVAKTVLGALQYSRCLSVLPNFINYYRDNCDIEGGLSSGFQHHAELILAHQTFGSEAGSEENDEAVKLLMQRYPSKSFFLVFDYERNKARPWIKELVRDFLRKGHGENSGEFVDVHIASCKAEWSDDGIRILEVLPRRFPLLLGSGDFRTQGKASNQLNGLRFANGHIVQAMDANMGVFIGEAFKIPFAMRRFLPSDVASRTVVQSRYIGFRERIFTFDDGTVGRCHASAEWTFGTIYQRFLSGLGTRMHYGHPDFVDAFWATNRGGMSKCSPAVNLSEDIFAGFNVKMREERCPHIDYLEFFKGREATLNAASNFFAKIAGGSVAVVRSRDLQKICEYVGVVHAFSFYFTSVAFYVSTLLVDLSIYLYVLLFLCFTLASQSIGSLDNLGSTLSLEWIVSLGLLCGIPQLLELILEYGAGTAVMRLLPTLLDTTIFFMFQNKTVASSVKEGAVTGMARYHFTGRPLANHHHTWRDNYIQYCHSHYYPAFLLLVLLMIYHMLTGINSEGTLPMILVIGSAVVWIVAPVIFTPFPDIHLMKQDLFGMWDFIMAPARANELQNSPDEPAPPEDGNAPSVPQDAPQGGPPSIKSRKFTAKPNDVRSLTEWGLMHELQDSKSMTWPMKFFSCLISTLVASMVLLVIPANILDYLVVFLFVFVARWLLVVLSLARNANNLLTFFSFTIWLLVPILSTYVVGLRGGSHMIEYVLCFVVFMGLMNCLRRWIILFGSCSSKLEEVTVNFGYHFFLKADLDIAAALVVLVMNVLATLALIVIECACCSPRGLHTWWLLNSSISYAASQKKPFTPGLTRELPNLRTVTTSWISASGGGSRGASGFWSLRRRSPTT